jgi:hypothetical protein
MAEERRTVPQDDEAARRRRQIIEEAKARWAAKKAALQGEAPAVAPEAPSQRAARAETPRPAPTVPVYAASLNPGATPLTAPTNPRLRALGTINQGVEIACEPSEIQNLRKLLGGIGAYQNPLRQNRFQVDYRYWEEARKRLSAAGYQIEQEDFMGRPLDEWDPLTRGWVRAEFRE